MYFKLENEFNPPKNNKTINGIIAKSITKVAIIEIDQKMYYIIIHHLKMQTQQYTKI